MTSARTDGRTLPWTFLRRQVRPYALAVSLATTVSIWSVSTDRAVGQLLDGWPGAIIAAYGVLAVLLLWVGFWARRDGWMRAGLLASAGYYVTPGPENTASHANRVSHGYQRGCSSVEHSAHTSRSSWSSICRCRNAIFNKASRSVMHTTIRRKVNR